LTAVAFPDPPDASGRPSRPRPQSAAEARAEVEARRSERAEARRSEVEAAFGGGVPGRAIVVVSWVASAVLCLLTAAAVAVPDEAIELFFAFTVGSFLAGSALLALDVVLAAGRSRTHAMGIGGLFFLAGSAPRPVQVQLNVALGLAVVVATAGAAVRPFTPLAFGVLAPVLQLGCSGLWGVRHGHFALRAPADPAGAP
jgi:hypothetical protein